MPRWTAGRPPSEEVLGQLVKEFVSRDSLVFVTKVHFPMRQGPNGGGLSRKALMTEIDANLRRLGTDYIDLSRIHRWDPATPIEETLETLHDIVKAGKAPYIGASSMYAWQFAKALFVADLHSWTRFASMQPYYNLLFVEQPVVASALSTWLSRKRHRRKPCPT
jgi:1-deoxyxylulose-5-phosphate synthase